MGNVYRRGAGAWSIRWMENGRRRFQSGYPDRAAAELALTSVLHDVSLGRHGIEVEATDPRTLNELVPDWLERRAKTHRAGDNDGYRWHKHLAPIIGHLRPGQVSTATLREIVEKKLGEGLSSATCGLLMRLVSTMFTDLCERNLAKQNPGKLLPRATRRLVKSSHDPRTTPFLRTKDDIRRVFLALPQQVKLAFAIGAFAGLRTNEIPALDWSHVDLKKRRIHVQKSATGKLKDDDSRIVPIMDTLYPLLAAAHLACGGKGPVVAAIRGKAKGARLDQHTMGTVLDETLENLKLPDITWYQATRHTFASHWVMDGGSIEKLREMLGHSSVLVTHRYAHLNPDTFSDKDRALLKVDLRPGRVIRERVMGAKSKAANDAHNHAIGYAPGTVDEGIA